MSALSRIVSITDGLFLSGSDPVTPENMKKTKITYVINCTACYPNVKARGVKVARIEIGDKPQSDLGKHFDEVADDIFNTVSAGGSVLVHCLAGVSRSVTLCIAYLMKYKKMTLLEAHEHVKKQRPIIRPNPGFWKQLVEYENKLFGSNTVHMVESAIGFIPDIYKEQTKNMI